MGTVLRGFGLKVTPKGHKTYVLQYRMGGRESPTRRYTLGPHGIWTPDKAREEAERLLTLVKQGRDPVALNKERRRIAVDLAFAKYADLFVERYAKRNKSWPETKRILDKDITPTLGKRPLPEITREEIARMLDQLGDRAPGAARHAHAVLRRLMRWAVDRGDLKQSPMAEMPPPSPVAFRDRVLTDGEIKRIWLACEKLGAPFGPLIRLLILTGQRRSEVAGMEWAEINGDTWTLPATRAKNRLKHIVPLNAPAQAILADLRGEEEKKWIVSVRLAKPLCRALRGRSSDWMD